MTSRRNFSYLGTAILTAFIAVPAAAQSGQVAVYEITVPAGDLTEALTLLARTTDREVIIAADAAVGKVAPRVAGRLTVEQAVARLLAGSGLIAEYRGNAILVRTGAVGRSGSQDDTPGEDIVVTGSSIRGAAPAGSPATMIDRRAIDQSGYATTQQVLQALPQSYRGGPNEASFGVSLLNGSENGEWQGASLNLRGLGAGSTLTLVNGRRLPLGGYGAFADISLIPSSAIDRIEVLTDGASAIYGSDAVAGVANVILRRRFVGAETRLRYGTADGAANEIQASQLFGARWNGGGLVAAYEYYQRGRLAAASRAFATEDLRSFGGADYRTGYGTPGTIVAGGRPYAIPQGQDGTALSPADLIPDQRNRGDSLAGSDLLPQQKLHSVFVSFHQDVGANLNIFADLLFSRRSFDVYPRLDFREPVSVPVSNPFYVDPTGGGQPVSVEYDFARDIGHLRRTGRAQIVTGSAGGEWRSGDWRVDGYGVYGSQSDDDRVTNYVNTVRLARALADPDPATALNVFGDGSYRNAAATIAAIRGSLNVDADYRMWSGTLKADGPLFAVSGGDVRLALGAEYRHETARSKLVTDLSSDGPTVRPYLEFPGARTVAAAFGELYAPLVSDANRRSGLERLTLSLAARVERYNGFGTTANPKIGISYSPTDGVSLRSSYGTSFRAPPFVNLIQTVQSRFFVPIALPDPQSPSGTTNVLVLYGNNPDLGPERARTLTLGLDLTPSVLPGLSANLTLFDIRYRERIIDPSGNIFAFLTDRTTFAPLLDPSPSAATIAALYARPEFGNPYGIAASDIDVIADARVTNLSAVSLRGIDFDIGYSFGTSPEKAEIGVSGSYLLHVNQAISPTAASVNVVNTIGQPVDLRLRGRASLTTDRWSVATFVNFTNGYRNTLIATRPHVASYTTVDAQLSYTIPASQGILQGASVSLALTNLFDRGPPFVEYATGASAIGYDPENASAIGRVVALSVIKKW